MPEVTIVEGLASENGPSTEPIPPWAADTIARYEATAAAVTAARSELAELGLTPATIALLLGPNTEES